MPSTTATNRKTTLIAIELVTSSRDETETAAAPEVKTAENAAAPQDAQAPMDYANTILARPLFRVTPERLRLSRCPTNELW